MRCRFPILTALLLALATLAASAAPANAKASSKAATPTLSSASALDPSAQFRYDVEALTRAPHRMAGTTEGLAAGQYIETQLRTLPGQFFQQHFSFPQTVTEVCELRTAKGTLPLLPLTPNGLQPCRTSAEGIEGRTVYIGKGTDAELNGKNLEGCIALADFAAHGIVNTAFRHGARALILLGDGTESRDWIQDKRTYVSVDLPRFYVSAAAARQAGLLETPSATLVSQVHWRRLTGRNLFLWIPARGGGSEALRREYVILSAPYDSDGIVPANSPSEEWAANCAALLETARRLAAAPSPRSVLIAFFDNHSNYLEGGRVFYTALRRSLPDRLVDPLTVRKQYVASERAFVQEVLDLLSKPDLLTSSHPRREKVLELLRSESRHRHQTYEEEASAMRLEIERKRLAEDPAHFTLETSLKDILVEKKKWQMLRESIRDRKSNPEVASVFKTTIEACTGRLTSRCQELDELDRNLGEDLALTTPLAQGTPVMHASFRFTAGSPRWMILPHGTVHTRLYATLIDEMLKGAPSPSALESGYVRESSTLPESFLSWLTTEESALADPFEIPGVTLATVQDPAPAMYMPGQRLPEERLILIRRQATAAFRFLTTTLSSTSSSVPNRITSQRRFFAEDYVWNGDTPEGHMIKWATIGSAPSARVQPGALAHLCGPDLKNLQGGCPDNLAVFEKLVQSPEFYTFTDGNGCFPISPILPWNNQLIEAGTFNTDGSLDALTPATDKGGLGSVESGWNHASYHSSKALVGFYSILNLFKGENARLVGVSMPFSESFKPSAFKLFNGLSNAPYKLSHLRFDPLRGLGMLYIAKPLGVKLIYRDPQAQDQVAIYLKSEPAHQDGIGYPPGNGAPPGKDTPLLDLQTASASDLYQLNESRLDVLRRKNIVINFLEWLHGQARLQFDALPETRTALRHGEADLRSGILTALERRIYRPVMATTNDMISAVTILLILAIPFAFSLQSLMLPSYNVYRQIGSFILCFFATFLILYWVHPAFAFASTPTIIILAFVIMVMGGTVIGIIAQKFMDEIRKLQGLDTSAHSFQRSGVGNLGAALSLAVATMRRRPARTVLTTATVLLLTFTILSFVSVQTDQGITRFYLGSGDSTTRILLHRKIWKPMDRHLITDLRRWLGNDSSLHGIYWLAREANAIDQTELRIPVLHPQGTCASAQAMMSLDAMELNSIPGLRAVLDGDVDAFLAGRGIFLPTTLATELKAKRGDILRLRGHDLAFLGTFDSRRLLDLRHLDGAPFLPINFSQAQLRVGKVSSKGSAGGDSSAQGDLDEELAKLEPQALEPVAPDSLIIVPSALEAPLRMSLQALTIYPGEKVDVEEMAERLAIFTGADVYLNQGGEIRQFIYGDTFGVSGIGDVMIPLLLGGFIIFSTMLGSVIDREKEIYTFSALGLAPRTIASLFFVEAGLYATLGGFGGYLFSQVVTRILEFLAYFGWFQAPEMNYSSSTAIQTILVVMATVMISTIYPAIQAARKATAETRSRWRVPPAVQGVCSFNFPFTISHQHVTGILCFIREHFASHADRTVGGFAADALSLFRDPTHGMTAIRATVWLQPFDQGISQNFEMTATPSDIEGVCEIHVVIRRLSGPPSAWERSNTVFLEDLRLQFLLWRTLGDGTMDHYLSIADKVEAEIKTAAPSPS